MGGDSGGKKDERQHPIESRHRPGASGHPSLHKEHRNGASKLSATFSSFIYGGAESAGHHDIPSMNEQATETSNMMLDDIFADMDPETSYYDNNIDFLDFLNPLNQGDTQNVNVVGQSQSGIQHPFVANINEFQPLQMDTHPGIVIPVNTTPEPPVQPERLIPLLHNRQTRPQLQLPINPNYSSNLPAVASTTEPLSSPNLAMRQMQRTTINQGQVHIVPQSYHSTLDDVGRATFSDTTPKLEFPIQAKPSSPTVPIARRKDSDTPSTESPTSFPKQSKTSHNMIEKRYRLKLNDKILSLRNAVPALRSPSTSITEHPDSGRGIANKLNKGTVLTKATEYIHQLEREKSTLEKEVVIFKRTIGRCKTRENFGPGF